MPKIAYKEQRFSVSSLKMIDQANRIIVEYQKQGFELTLRQLYYQFVSRDLLANQQKEYKRLGSVINDGRLAGLIDWKAIVDRTRNLEESPHWEAPQNIVEACAKQFRIDRWDTQPVRPEVWIEKDALIGVIERVCSRLDVPYFSCRGYTSQSEMWAAAQRLEGHIANMQQARVIHLGDHDPSGIDMSRDIEDRIRMFLGDQQEEFDFTRIALNMEQVEEYNPPPNPAKLSDSRAADYIENYGDESWELDALSPKVLADLIESQIRAIRDEEKWDAAIEREAQFKEQLQTVADEWDTLVSETKKRS